MSFFRLIMNAIAISFIVCGCVFNSCAIAFLILENRKRALQKKNFKKNLEEIDFHLVRVRTGGITRD